MGNLLAYFAKRCNADRLNVAALLHDVPMVLLRSERGLGLIYLISTL